MTLRVWELAVGIAAALFGLLLLLSNVWGIGVGVLCADGVWLATRLRIVERAGEAGRYASIRGRVGLVKTCLVIGIYAAAVYGMVIVNLDGGGKTRLGVVATFGLSGLAFMLLGELQRSGNDAINWLLGARGERRVGTKLDTLKADGWFVLHGYKRERGGDVDHIVVGPRGAYAVETKSYRFRRADLRQAAYNAAWLKETLGVRWVTAVLCVDEERAPTQDGVVWVMGHEALLPWIRTQRNTSVDPGLAHRVLIASDSVTAPE